MLSWEDCEEDYLVKDKDLGLEICNDTWESHKFNAIMGCLVLAEILNIIPHIYINPGLLLGRGNSSLQNADALYFDQAGAD